MLPAKPTWAIVRSPRPMTPPLTPSAFHLARLEASGLYRRREQDAQTAQADARLRALWYLSPSFKPRWRA